MRDLRELDRYRVPASEHYGWDGDQTCGAFALPSVIDRAPLRVIASAAEGWDHVSVSRANRCPNWPEMEQVKRAFFRDDETAMQLHVPTADHINVHPHTLHLWRPNNGTVIPLPPKVMV